MSRGLAEVLERRGQLADHYWHEAGVDAEEGFDVGVAEGQVGEGDDGVATDLRAGGFAGRLAVGGFLDLKNDRSLD